MSERALERRKAARRLEKRRSAALEIQVRTRAAASPLRSYVHAQLLPSLAVMLIRVIILAVHE
jgi:hypothetical protein|eukprot:COSAG02_NODE_4059_length_5845_cov_3.052732_5_plen_63_part_00